MNVAITRTNCPRVSVTTGVRVPGTNYELDAVQGAFNIGAMILC
jgi:2-methylcitrate dehydratase PrpD